MDALVDRILQHPQSVQPFLLQVLDSHLGDVIRHPLLDQFFFRYDFELLGLDLHQLAGLLAVRGQRAIAGKDERGILINILRVK